MSHRIRNTTRLVEESPAEGMILAMDIEGSERRGQAELLRSTTLPVRLIDGTDADFLALGFTFGAAVPGDDLFREATLPEGWARTSSDHAMWSSIVDTRGIRRVAIFYKAAYYDRAAHMALVNVGHKAASEAIYGDEAITRESLRLDVLTSDEIAEARICVRRMREDIAQHPTIYGTYRERTDAVAGLLG